MFIYIDDVIIHYIIRESWKQRSSINLIASENIASSLILHSQGSIFTNKYAEGYSKLRYYSGCLYLDVIEELAIARAKILYSSFFVNVQLHSGSQANQSVFFSLLKPLDKILGLSLNCGGHITHGATSNVSGTWLLPYYYFVDYLSLRIDYQVLLDIAFYVFPKLIICGGSSYPRNINLLHFKNIANLINSYLVIDISHISGIIASHYHFLSSSMSHFSTSTTHKTLRGPRGGVIFTNFSHAALKINFCVFPGIQGGPFMHSVLGKAVAFYEALHVSFKYYIYQTLLNSKVLSRTILNKGYDVVSQGTDTHLLLLDLRGFNISGKTASNTLQELGILCNPNNVPFDFFCSNFSSGIRLGTASSTSRGFKCIEFQIIGTILCDILNELSVKKIIPINNFKNYFNLRLNLCSNFFF